MRTIFGLFALFLATASAASVCPSVDLKVKAKQANVIAGKNAKLLVEIYNDGKSSISNYVLDLGLAPETSFVALVAFPKTNYEVQEDGSVIFDSIAPEHKVKVLYEVTIENCAPEDVSFEITGYPEAHDTCIETGTVDMTVKRAKGGATCSPTTSPSSSPVPVTTAPSTAPSYLPTSGPSRAPTFLPTSTPTSLPTLRPTSVPSATS